MSPSQPDKPAGREFLFQELERPAIDGNHHFIAQV
jgi:hypothetical protein